MYIDEILTNIYLDNSDKPMKKLAKYKNNRMFIDIFCFLMNMCLNRLRFKNLPPTMSPRVICQSLVYRASFVVFEMENNLFALSGRPTSDFNVNGDPKYAYVWGKNGFNKEVRLFIPGADNSNFLNKGISTVGDNSKPNAVLVRENYLMFPIIEYCIFYADAIADTYRTLDVVRQNIKQPYIITGEESIIPTIKAFFKNRDNNESYIVSTGIFPADKISLLPFDVNDSNLKNATDLIEWYLSQFYETIGVKTNNNPDKKAQVSVEEITGNQESVLFQIDNVVDCINEHLDIVNKCFGTHIVCEKNEVKDEDLSGNQDGEPDNNNGDNGTDKSGDSRSDN